MEENRDSLEEQENDGVSGAWLLGMFDKSPVGKLCLKRIKKMLGITLGLDCLAIGGVAAIHHQLRAYGGSWQNADMTESGMENIVSTLTCPPRSWEPQTVTRARAGSHQVQLIEDGVFPYEDGTFDRVILLNGLEGLEDDHAFIAECHRVMKESAHLILNVAHAKPWTMLSLLRRLLGMSDQKETQYRQGYSKSDVFHLLKDGFDVQDVQSYSRFFSLSSELLVEFFAGFFIRVDEEGNIQPDSYKHVYRMVCVTYPLCWLASKMDALLFFTRGYRLVIKAERRVWRPRHTPVLLDGRSIAEATLQTRIGTANTF